MNYHFAFQVNQPLAHLLALLRAESRNVHSHEERPTEVRDSSIYRRVTHTCTVVLGGGGAIALYPLPTAPITPPRVSRKEHTHRHTQACSVTQPPTHTTTIRHYAIARGFAVAATNPASLPVAGDTGRTACYSCCRSGECCHVGCPM